MTPNLTRRGLLQAAAAGALHGGFEDDARRIFVRVNELRATREALPLIWREDVADRAREQCRRKDLLRFRGHEDPEFGGVAERLNAAGIRWDRCGENVFQMNGYDDPVNFSIVFWWYSPGHRENMLNPEFTHTGVGVTRGTDGTYFVAQIFMTAPAVPSRQRDDRAAARSSRAVP